EGEERLVILQELEAGDGVEASAILAGIRKVVARRHGLKIHVLLLLPPGSLPRTRNQKIQRYACKPAFLGASLKPLAEFHAGTDAEKSNVAAGLVPDLCNAEDLEGWLMSRLSVHLHMEPEAFDLKLPLSAYGLDSLAAVEFAFEIERDLGVPVLIQE